MAGLARFLFDRRDYSPANRAVRPSAFLPRDGKTSVFEVSELGAHEIVAIGASVAEGRGLAARGRGELLHRHVTEAGLRFHRDDRPFRHGNLVGWPLEGAECKARQKAISVALAACAVLVLH